MEGYRSPGVIHVEIINTKDGVEDSWDEPNLESACKSLWKRDFRYYIRKRLLCGEGKRAFIWENGELLEPVTNYADWFRAKQKKENPGRC